MKRFALTMIAVTTTACASGGHGSFREPVVTYKDAVITGLGVSGGSLEVVLSVYNPNGFRLDGARLTYRLTSTRYRLVPARSRSISWFSKETRRRSDSRCRSPTRVWARLVAS